MLQDSLYYQPSYTTDNQLDANFGPQLLEKVLWDVLVSFRKFLQVARTVANDKDGLWDNHMTPEIRKILIEWLPAFQQWTNELSNLEAEAVSSAHSEEGKWDLWIAQIGNTPPEIEHMLQRLSHPALGLDCPDDAMWQSMLFYLKRLKPIREDIRQRNYGRLWITDYNQTVQSRHTNYSYSN